MLLQVAGLCLSTLVVSVAACIGCAAFQLVLALSGAHLQVSGAAYAVAALVAASHPVLALFGLLAAPVS